jgi:hypothetical protein
VRQALSQITKGGKRKERQGSVLLKAVLFRRKKRRASFLGQDKSAKGHMAQARPILVCPVSHGFKAHRQVLEACLQVPQSPDQDGGLVGITAKVRGVRQRVQKPQFTVLLICVQE